MNFAIDIKDDIYNFFCKDCTLSKKEKSTIRYCLQNPFKIDLIARIPLYSSLRIKD